MPVANINREFQLGELDQNSKAIVQALGEIYSNKNLGLNTRVISSSGSLDKSDVYVQANTSGGSLVLTLCASNTWSSRSVLKTPFIIIQNVGTTNAVVVNTTGSDTIVGDAFVYPGETKIYISNGVDKWTMFLSSSAATLDWVNVKTLGAVGDGLTNDRSAIQAAIDFVHAAGGGVVYFPHGVYVTDSWIGYKENVSLIGAGRGATIIKLATGAGLTGSKGILQPGDITAALPATGYRSSKNTIAHLSINGNRAGNPGMFYEGIAGYQCKDLLVFDVESYSCGECGLQAQVTNTGSDQNSLIIFSNCSAYDNVADGIQVGGVIVENCHCYENSGAGILSAGNFVLGSGDDICTQIIGCRVRNNVQGGIVSSLQSGPDIRTIISGCYSSHNPTDGINASMQYTEISDCVAEFNDWNGIVLNSDSCSVTGGRANGNGQSAVGANNYRTGLLIQGARNRCTVNGLTSTDDQGVPTQQYSVAFSAPGGSDNVMTGCNFKGNVLALAYQLASVTDWIMTGNIGLNPTGPFGAGTGSPANPAVPATTVAHTNTYGYDCMVSIAGGTVTDISIDGYPTNQITGTFIVGPAQTITLTYAVAPTWQWYGL